jgi:galactokinase
MSLAMDFEAMFGRAPEVEGSAPGRVNVIGEHIDYSEGWVLPYAIGFRTHVAIARRDDSTIMVVSLQRPNKRITVSASALTPRVSESWADYVLGVIAALGVAGGFDILVDGNVPTGAGLSSSAALECATAVGLNALLGLGNSQQDLALAAQRAENDFVGMPCGIMDQAVSMMAREAQALLLDCKTLDTQHIPLDLASAGLAMLVIDTQAKHALVDGEYAQRRQSCEEAASILGLASLRNATLSQLAEARSKLTDSQFKRARHAVTEMGRVHAAVDAMRAHEWAELGRLLTQSHESLRDDYTVSCAELDLAVTAAMAVGAFGARMVGGGFGGSAIALTPVGLIPAIESAVKDAYAATGFSSPRFFVATPEGGAYATLLS